MDLHHSTAAKATQHYTLTEPSSISV